MITFHMLILWAIQRSLGAREETNADVHTECPVSVSAFGDGLSKCFFGQVELPEQWGGV